MGMLVKVAFADKLSSTLDARFEAYIVDHAPPPSCRVSYNFIIMTLRLLASVIQLFNLTHRYRQYSVFILHCFT